MMRKHAPVAWTFHRNTIRWPYNMLEPPDSPSAAAPFKEYPLAPATPLPSPTPLDRTLADAIAGRRSCRRFSRRPVSLPDLSACLAATYGIRERLMLAAGEHFVRPVPSGGGLYPLELYVLALGVEDLAPGVYHYAPIAGVLESLAPGTLPPAILSTLLMGQPYAAAAPVLVCITAIAERTMHKYGDRGYRYILFEAGHAAQNLNLACAALGLSSLNLGGFFDEPLAELLGVDAEEEPPLYVVALGHPESDDPVLSRTPVPPEVPSRDASSSPWF